MERIADVRYTFLHRFDAFIIEIDIAPRIEGGERTGRRPVFCSKYEEGLDSHEGQAGYPQRL